MVESEYRIGASVVATYRQLLTLLNFISGLVFQLNHINSGHQSKQCLIVMTVPLTCD